jgi:uncharacterized protein YbjT (DUF2867 family)
MGAITPSSKKQMGGFGNLDAVLATFASIADADTWATGLGKVEAVFIINSVSGKTYGATYSAGTVTFACSAALASAKVLALGYK